MNVLLDINALLVWIKQHYTVSPLRERHLRRYPNILFDLAHLSETKTTILNPDTRRTEIIRVAIDHARRPRYGDELMEEEGGMVIDVTPYGSSSDLYDTTPVQAVQPTTDPIPRMRELTREKVPTPLKKVHYVWPYRDAIEIDTLLIEANDAYRTRYGCDPGTMYVSWWNYQVARNHAVSQAQKLGWDAYLKRLKIGPRLKINEVICEG